MTEGPATPEASAVIVGLEGVLWQPGGTWPRLVEHLASRFGRVRPLDVGALRHLDLAAQVRYLDQWAGDDIDWVREATRWLDEHLSLYVRPDRVTNQQLRQLAAVRPVEAWSALPRGPMEAILRHVGVLRSLTRLRDRCAAEPSREPGGIIVRQPRGDDAAGPETVAAALAAARSTATPGG